MISRLLPRLVAIPAEPTRSSDWKRGEPRACSWGSAMLGASCWRRVETWSSGRGRRPSAGSLPAGSPSGLSPARRLRHLQLDPAGDVVAAPIPVHQDGRVWGLQRCRAALTNLPRPVHRALRGKLPCFHYHPEPRQRNINAKGRIWYRSGTP